MATVPIDLAAGQLPELFARAAAGEDVVIEGAQRMKLVPEPTRTHGQRQPGTWKGRVSIPPSFWEPLPDEWIGWPGDARD